MFPQITTVSYGRVRGNARKYQYWQACLYEYRPRKSDGKLIARLVCTIGKPYRCEWKAKMDAVEYAIDNNIIHDTHVRQNQSLPPQLMDYMNKWKEQMKELDKYTGEDNEVFYDEVMTKYD